MSEPASARFERRSLASAPIRVVSHRASLLTRLKSLWGRRELLVSLTASDIKIKYKNSTLGFFWSMLSPALTLAIYFMVFGVVLKSGIPDFALYLFSGLVVWNLFSNAVNTATGVIVERSGLVKKVSFPREILALSNVGAAVVYFFSQLLVLAVVLAAMRHAPDWGYMWLLPLAFVSLYFFTAAVAMLMSGITVYMRDMKHLMEVALMLWFWLTPVVYSYSNSMAQQLRSHGLLWIYFCNPITWIVLTFQRIFYVTQVAVSPKTNTVIHVLPNWPLSTYVTMNVALVGITIALFLVAETLFGRLEVNFESEL